MPGRASGASATSVSLPYAVGRDRFVGSRTVRRVRRWTSADRRWRPCHAVRVERADLVRLFAALAAMKYDTVRPVDRADAERLRDAFGVGTDD